MAAAVKYQVWRSGWIITESNEPAALLGEADAESFEQACAIVLRDDKEFDPIGLTKWGCKLWDNETDARRFNG
jgi:hypothetical protein